MFLLLHADLIAADQFIKIIERLIRVFQTLVVQHKAFDHVFTQGLRRPDTESGRHMAFYPVTHENNHIQVVMIEQPLNAALAFAANCQVFLDSCLRFQLAFLVNILYWKIL